MFTVRLQDDHGWLDFSSPHMVLRAGSADAAYDALGRAADALDDGAWIAGVVPYELDGLAIGVFDAPVRRTSYDAKAYAVSPPLATVSMAAYRNALERIARWIYDGDVYQVNYTVPFEIAIDGDAFSLWYALAQRTHARYQAYVQDDDRRSRILSWSPELFLAFDGSRITAKPMKGTSLPDDTSTLADEKNRAEHVMIVDLLRNDLRRVCDTVDVTSLNTIERYPTFATMTSTIEGTLRTGVCLAEIFRAAFPCGSVTGAPKRAAMQAIIKTESLPRGAYCGSIGFLSPQRQGWWNVAIRTAQCTGDGARFNAGGGIVSDSRSDDEWREIAIKSSFLRAQARRFRLWETFSGDASDEIVERHLARLIASAALLDIAVNPDVLRARMLGARKTGTLVRMRVSLDGAASFHHDDLSATGCPVTVCLAEATVRSADPWLHVKSSWRPAHVRAWDTAIQRGCFDAVLQNERDEITEGSRTNVFAEIDGVLYTPPLTCGLLPGILRARLISEERVQERVLDAGDLHRASALYVGNSARGLLRATLQP